MNLNGDSLTERGATLFLAEDNTLLGVLGVADRIKEDSRRPLPV